MLFGEPILIELARLGHANDLNLIGMMQRILRVAGSTTPRADDYQLHWWHRSFSLSCSGQVSQGAYEIKVEIRALASTIPHWCTQRRPSLALLRPPYSMGVNS
jgi:hypothetical protein